MKSDYPFIHISLHTYYVGEYVTGSGEEHEINYSIYISRQNLMSVDDGREIHFLGIKTDNGITPVSEILPYKGMPEKLINSTKLGKATAVNDDPLKYSKFYDQTVARREGYHKYYWKIPYYAKQSEYLDWLYAYYAVETRNGVVEWVRHCDDPYKACEFNDPEDFYDYYYYDFEDYEEAYDYYYDHQHD